MRVLRMFQPEPDQLQSHQGIGFTNLDFLENNF